MLAWKHNLAISTNNQSIYQQKRRHEQKYEKYNLIYILELVLLQELTEEANRAPFNDAKFLSSNGQPKELFLSSDPSALVEHTKKVLVIEDGEVVHVKVISFLLYFFRK